MITDWRYVDVPAGIDLTQPLMPFRDEIDDGRYGVDPAWQREILSTWAVMIKSGGGKLAMPESPSADFINGLRSVANTIKTRTADPSSVPDSRLICSAAPSAAIPANVSTNSFAVTFGDVPPDVKKGDLVRRADTMDMFDWMNAGVSHLRFSNQSTVDFSSYSTEQGTEGTGSLPMPVPCPVVYDWDWYYSDGTHSDTNGYWRRMTANTFPVTATLTGARAEWFESATMFLYAGAYTEPEQIAGDSSFYVPIGNATITQTGDDVTISATTSGAEIRSAFNITERAYKAGLEGDSDYRHGHYRCTIQTFLAGTWYGILCFLKLAANYRYPENAGGTAT